MEEVINGTCDCHWKGMENWIGAKTVVFCSGYNASTLFSSLLRTESMQLSKQVTNYESWSGFLYYNITTPHREGTPYPPPA